MPGHWGAVSLAEETKWRHNTKTKYRQKTAIQEHATFVATNWTANGIDNNTENIRFHDS
jgi:hypothetical protein